MLNQINQKLNLNTSNGTGKFLLIVTVAVALSACNGNAGNSNTNNAPVENNTTANSDSGMVKGSDSAFIKEAAKGGMMEVEMGSMAERMAKSGRVKNYGTMMVHDHTNANNELKSVAATKNVDVSAIATDKDEMDKLSKKKGAEFDKAYMDMMVEDHVKDIDAFKQEASNGKDPDVKAFASKTLPTLQTHLDSAKAIQEYVVHGSSRAGK